MLFKEPYSESDLVSACEFGKIDSSTLKFCNYSLHNPLELLNNPGISGVDFSYLEKYSFGWGKEKTKEEVLETLASFNNSLPVNWEVYSKTEYGGLPPVILIDNRLFDGFHRSLYCHLMGEKVLAAEFKTI